MEEEGGGKRMKVSDRMYFSSDHLLQCVDVHYIEFFTERMFMEPTLNSKVPKSYNCRDLCTFTFDDP